MRLSAPAARLLYVAVVLVATFMDLEGDLDPARAARRLRRALHPQLTARDVVDGVRNLLLFAGLGLTWLVTAPVGRERAAALAATVAGFLLSVAVESGQLLSPIRTASVLDVATNTLGTLAGASAAAAATRALARRRARRSYFGVPALALALPYGLAALGQAFAPLYRNAPVAGAWGGPARRFAVALAASRGAAPVLPVADLVLFAPAGALLVAGLVEVGLGWGLAVAASAGAGVLLSVLAELARGAAGQPMAAGAVAVHALGWAGGAVAAGWGLAPFSRRLRGARRVAAWVAAYAAILAVWAWRPFRLDLRAATLTAELAVAHLVPLAALGERGDLVSAADVATQFFLLVPLGVVAAVWRPRDRGALGGVLPVLALALALEAGQLVVADRFFDVTDWLVQCAGALVGYTLARRAGFRPRVPVDGGAGTRGRRGASDAG